jgi:hypothetical protein
MCFSILFFIPDILFLIDLISMQAEKERKRRSRSSKVYYQTPEVFEHSDEGESV